jgi:hypothetical protein
VNGKHKKGVVSLLEQHYKLKIYLGEGVSEMKWDTLIWNTSKDNVWFKEYSKQEKMVFII